MSNTRYISNQNFAISTIAGEDVLTPVSNSVDTLSNMFILNRTSVAIINAMSEGKTASEIAELLTQNFQVSYDKALSDTLAYADKMVEKGFFRKETE